MFASISVAILFVLAGQHKTSVRLKGRMSNTTDGSISVPQCRVFSFKKSQLCRVFRQTNVLSTAVASFTSPATRDTFRAYHNCSSTGDPKCHSVSSLTEQKMSSATHSLVISKYSKSHSLVAPHIHSNNPESNILSIMYGCLKRSNEKLHRQKFTSHLAKGPFNLTSVLCHTKMSASTQ